MAKRTPMRSVPIHLEKRAWTEAKTLTVMGVDPGWAAMGVAILVKAENQAPVCHRAGVIRTAKAKKKDLRNIRVAADDSRRIRELHNGLADLATAFSPQALAFEVYSPYGKQGGSAWKSSRVEGGVQLFGLERGMLVLPFHPQDLKRAICGKVSSSKDDVIREMSVKVANLEAMLAQLPKTMREHAADAAGYAYLAFEEMMRMRAMMGL